MQAFQRSQHREVTEQPLVTANVTVQQGDPALPLPYTAWRGRGGSVHITILLVCQQMTDTQYCFCGGSEPEAWLLLAGNKMGWGGGEVGV